MVSDGSMMTDELERIWKEAVMAYSRSYPRNFPMGTEEDHRKFR
jgi:hypothetical protein